MHKQLSDKIIKDIENGALKAGDHLPSIRQLSMKLGVSTATVSAAYAFLVQRRILVSNPRSGYVVAGKPEVQVVSDSEVSKILRLDRIVPFLPVHPVLEFGEIVAEVSRSSVTAGGYEDYYGFEPLRDEALRHAQTKGINISGLHALITNGTQQAIHIIGEMIRPGDKVLVEEPAYPGALRIFENAGAVLLSVPMTPQGPDINVMEDFLKRDPVRFMYACPTYQNPTGYSYSVDVRRVLVELAFRYRFKIFEDDYLGDLDYLNESLPTLKSLDQNGDRVIYAHTFSKSLLPGLRTAYVLADAELINRMVRIRHSIDICGSAYLERALATYLSQGLYDLHLERIRTHYSTVREAMKGVLGSLRAQINCTEPPSGLCVFCTLPGGFDSTKYAQKCLEHGVVISEGSPYYPKDSAGHRAFRLAFSGLSVEELCRVPEKMLAALEYLDTEFDMSVL